MDSSAIPTSLGRQPVADDRRRLRARRRRSSTARGHDLGLPAPPGGLQAPHAGALPGRALRPQEGRRAEGRPRVTLERVLAFRPSAHERRRLSRSSRPLGGLAMTYVLLLLAVALLVALNGFFVAAEFALVRSRRSRLEQMADEGDRAGGARAAARWTTSNEYLAACQLGITLASIGIGFLGEPAIADLLEDIFGDSVPHGVVARDLVRARLPDHDRAAHHARRAGAEDLLDRARRRRSRGAWPRPLQFFYVVFRPGVAALNSVSNGILRAARRQPAGRARGGVERRGPQAADRPERARRRARPGRGRDALGRLPPARAAGAPGDDADPGGGHRGHVGGRRDGAAPLRRRRATRGCS